MSTELHRAVDSWLKREEEAEIFDVEIGIKWATGQPMPVLLTEVINEQLGGPANVIENVETDPVPLLHSSVVRANATL